MTRSRFSGTLSTPTVDFVIDTGNPFLNITIDGFLKIGSLREPAADDAYHVVRKVEEDVQRGRILGYSSRSICGSGVGAREDSKHKRLGMFLFQNWILERGRVFLSNSGGLPRQNPKNAMLGSALTGALVSAASNSSSDKVVVDAITGGAVATAAEFLNYLT